ncbi:MAG: hypothetical protein IJQ58_07980 [Synergistaceae bacterium]|nr:hypothetical protein [Synergistaceae bacterium]
MANYFDELIARAEERAEKRAEERVEKRAKKRIAEKVARNLIVMGENSLETIATVTGLTLKRVQKLAETLHKS